MFWFGGRPPDRSVGTQHINIVAWVYILRSLRDGRFYMGSTINLEKRPRHHNGGFTPSTKRFGGTELTFSQEFSALSEARTIERRLKKLKRRDYIEKIIKDGGIRMGA